MIQIFRLFYEYYITIMNKILIMFYIFYWILTIDIKKVDKQLTHAMHVKDRYVICTFIDKLTKWYP